MKKKVITQYWKLMIDHINEVWKQGREYNYPFTGRDFKDLKHFANYYQPWGIMAAWDIYIEKSNDWLKEQGQTVYQFTRNLPRLLDDSTFKSRSHQYEKRLIPSVNQLELFGKLKIDPLKTLKNGREGLLNH